MALYKRLKKMVRSAYWRLRVSPTARKIKAEDLTYLSYEKLYVLEKAIREVRQLDGMIVEAGVARGGSAVLMASNLAGERKLRGYDTFEGIPEPSESDGEDAVQRFQRIEAGKAEGLGGNRYYGYEDDLLNEVRENIRRYGIDVDGETVALIKGEFEKTLEFPPATRIALVHVDCDWYESVVCVLRRVETNVVGDGLIVVDDYLDYSGARRATDEFLEETDHYRMVRREPSAVLKRLRPASDE